MKPINTYITEGIFKNIGADRPKPKDVYELMGIIRKTIAEKGPKCDLNFIDVSRVEDMGALFSIPEFRCFDGDISEWDVSGVKTMNSMFAHSKFNGDISAWDTSNVVNMRCMFSQSKFNGDISRWNTSKVTTMNSMFFISIFNGDISRWDVSKVENMAQMFRNSKFTGNLSKWKISPPIYMDDIARFSGMIYNCRINPRKMPPYIRDNQSLMSSAMSSDISV